MDKPESPTPVRLPNSQPNEPRDGESIVISQATIYYFVIAVLFFVAGFAVSWILFATTTGNTLNSIRSDVVAAAQQAVTTAVASMPRGNPVAIQPTETPVPRQNVSAGDGAAWGPANAKVTIVEFSDFQCPYCERFYKFTYPLLKQQYGDKIRFVFRHFPLSQIHPQAEISSIAAECANEQGKFWEYHDVLFSNQQNLTRDSLIKYADTVKVSDAPAFVKCLDTAKYQSKVVADFNEGAGYSVSGTPTFFINGNMLVGAQPFDVFAKAIDAELAQAGR